MASPHPIYLASHGSCPETHPLAPKDALTAESIMLMMGLRETEHDASTATSDKKPPATNTDERVTTKVTINP